jgi:hypothetical protein
MRVSPGRFTFSLTRSSRYGDLLGEINNKCWDGGMAFKTGEMCSQHFACAANIAIQLSAEAVPVA